MYPKIGLQNGDDMDNKIDLVELGLGMAVGKWKGGKDTLIGTNWESAESIFKSSTPVILDLLVELKFFHV